MFEFFFNLYTKLKLKVVAYILTEDKKSVFKTILNRDILNFLQSEADRMMPNLLTVKIFSMSQNFQKREPREFYFNVLKKQIVNFFLSNKYYYVLIFIIIFFYVLFI